MMVIPCGHTLCKLCSEGLKICPFCNSPVVSLTVNIMLQQVIQEYHANPANPRQHEEVKAGGGGEQAQTQIYTEGTHSFA